MNYGGFGARSRLCPNEFLEYVAGGAHGDGPRTIDLGDDASLASPALALPVIAARAGAKPPPEPSNREKPPNLVAFCVGATLLTVAQDPGTQLETNLRVAVQPSLSRSPAVS